MSAKEERILPRSMVLGSLVTPASGDVKARRRAVLRQAQLTLEISLQFSPPSSSTWFPDPMEGEQMGFILREQGVSFWPVF